MHLVVSKAKYKRFNVCCIARNADNNAFVQEYRVAHKYWKSIKGKNKLFM